MLFEEKHFLCSMLQTSSLYLAGMKNYEHLNFKKEEQNYEKTQFLFFENSIAVNFSYELNRKIGFMALKRANFFISIASI